MTHCYKKEYMNDDLVVWTWLTPQGLLTMTVEFFSNLKLELVWCVDTPWLSDSCRSLPPCVRITPFLPVPPCCDPPALPAVVDSPDVWVPPHKSRDMILWLDGGVVSHSSSCTLFPIFNCNSIRSLHSFSPPLCIACAWLIQTLDRLARSARGQREGRTEKILSIRAQLRWWHEPPYLSAISSLTFELPRACITYLSVSCWSVLLDCLVGKPMVRLSWSYFLLLFVVFTGLSQWIQQLPDGTTLYILACFPQWTLVSE